MSKVVVVGGGAAGMMAAISAADAGHQVVLLEQNEKLGKKLFITGKGRCNVTNACERAELLEQVVRNPRFLYSAFSEFDNYAMMDFLTQAGLRLKKERGNRVFPASDHSSDVIRTLEQAMKQRNVMVMLKTRVLSLLIEDDRCNGICYRGTGEAVKELWADAVILTTGGLAYPSTGANGSGYQMAADCGHRIEPEVPSLVPFEIQEEFCKALQGLSLKNVSLKLMSGKKVVYQELGEMLFTHFGISGPLVLSASTYAAGRAAGMSVVMDLKPGLSEEQLDHRIQRDLEEAGKSYFKNSLHKLLPSKLIPVVVELSDIPPDKQACDVNKAERKRLVDICKSLSMTVKGTRGFDEAIITRGGVSIKQVDPGTMESKLVSGLYFAGEILDLDAKTGGFNLQIAWSTGYLAGKLRTKKKKEKSK